MVNMLNPRTAKTFQDYGEMSITPYIKSQLLYSNRVHLVWDRYDRISLKASTRTREEQEFDEECNQTTSFCETGKASSEWMTTRQIFFTF